jgi:metal-responsive CopG/Arc/MetJ family transcriptional regulator
MAMARTQTKVQFTDGLLSALDQHVAQVGRSRSDVIREAVETYLGNLPEAEADRRLIESYTRMPQEDWPDDYESVRESIEEEPW